MMMLENVIAPTAPETSALSSAHHEDNLTFYVTTRERSGESPMASRGCAKHPTSSFCSSPGSCDEDETVDDKRANEIPLKEEAAREPAYVERNMLSKAERRNSDSPTNNRYTSSPPPSGGEADLEAMAIMTRKQLHNMREQRRMKKITDLMNCIRTKLISAGCEVRREKHHILTETLDYIRSLESRVAKLEMQQHHQQQQQQPHRGTPTATRTPPVVVDDYEQQGETYLPPHGRSYYAPHRTSSSVSSSTYRRGQQPYLSSSRHMVASPSTAAPPPSSSGSVRPMYQVNNSLTSFGSTSYTGDDRLQQPFTPQTSSTFYPPKLPSIDKTEEEGKKPSSFPSSSIAGYSSSGSPSGSISDMMAGGDLPVLSSYTSSAIASSPAKSSSYRHHRGQRHHPYQLKPASYLAPMKTLVSTTSASHGQAGITSNGAIGGVDYVTEQTSRERHRGAIETHSSPSLFFRGGEATSHQQTSGAGAICGVEDGAFLECNELFLETLGIDFRSARTLFSLCLGEMDVKILSQALRSLMDGRTTVECQLTWNVRGRPSPVHLNVSMLPASQSLPPNRAYVQILL